MRLFLTEDSNKIQLDDVLQLKDSTLIAQSFYYILELASKNIIRPLQTEPYGSIDIQFV